MTKVTICGCGNAAQLMAALVAKGDGADVCVYAPFMDEAARFQKALQDSPDSCVEVVASNEEHSFKAKIDPKQITKDPKEAISDADLLLCPLPAFAVGPTLRDIGKYVKNGAHICILPGQGGFQWAAFNALGKDFYEERKIVLFAVEKLPYNVRILEYGRKLHLFSYKRVGIGAIPASKAAECVKLLSDCVPYTDAVPLSHVLTTTLTTGNQCIHPARMYSLDRPEKPYDRNPLFYEEMDQVAADRIQGVSDEIAAISKALEKKAPSVDLSGVLDVKDALIGAYGKDIEDNSSLLTVLATNKGFKGIYSPMKELENGTFVVDLKSRYLIDDTPYGLCVLRGLAEIVDVPTPTVDELIYWGQKHMNKEYLVDGKLCGKDVGSTGAPQAYGFKSLADLPEAKM